MKDFERLLKNINALDIDDIFKTLWSRNDVQKYILKLNTKGEKTSQLYELGEDSLGDKLEGFGGINWLVNGEYASYTIEKKIDKGQRHDHPTLENKGDFYKSFIVLPNNKGFKVDADFNVTGDNGESGNILDTLANGREILGLNEKNVELLLAFIEPDFDKELEKRLFA